MFKKVNTIPSIAVIIVGILVIIVSEYFHLNRSYLGVTLLISSILYLYIGRNLVISQVPCSYISQKSYIFLLSTLLFVICYIISIFLLKAELYHRTSLYFLIITLTCLIISFQIFASTYQVHIWLILIEIFLVSVNIRAGVYYEFPTLYGFDPNYHIDLISQIVNYSHLPNGFDYSAFPIMHVQVAIINILSAMSFKDSFFIISIIEVLSTIFIFLTGRHVFNTQIGLLATLILNVSNYHILWGYWVISMSLATAIVSIIIYLIMISLSKGQKLVTYRVLVITFLALLILTHTLSTFSMFVMLVSIFLADQFHLLIDKTTSNSIISVNLLFFFVTSFLCYWIYAFYSPITSFFSLMVESVKSALSVSEIGQVSTVSMASELNSTSLILNELGYCILITFVIIGILIALSFKRIDRDKFCLIACIVAIFSVIYIPSLAGINSLLPARWFVFGYLVASVFAAYGIYAVILVPKSAISKNILAFFIICTLTFFMITSPNGANTDSPIYSKETAQRAGFFESEVKAITFLTKFCGGSFAINSRYGVLLDQSVTRYHINPENPKTYSSDLVIIRKTDFQEGFFIPFPKGKISENIIPGDKFISHLRTISTVYDNSEVKIYASSHKM